MRPQRPGQKVFADPGPDWGVRVVEPGFPVGGSGWWDDFGAIGCCVGAWQAVAVADYATSLLDLSGNGNNLTAIIAVPSWNAVQGWNSFRVAPQRALDTGLTPAADQSWSMIVQFTNAVMANTALCGAHSGANAEFQLQPTRIGAFHRYGNGGAFSVAGAVVAGNLCVAGGWGYLNGVPDVGPIWPWANPSLWSVYIGACNIAAVPTQTFDGWIRAAALYDCVLTPAEVAVVAAGMAIL